MYFNSAYNVQVILEDNEPKEKLLGRFRREVMKAGVIQECKRRRYFENNLEEKKRKHREAAKRNRRSKASVDVIETYVFWNGHEPSPGNYYFGGRYDLSKFVNIVQDARLLLILRIGPFAAAEWNFGLNMVLGVKEIVDNLLQAWEASTGQQGLNDVTVY